MMSGKDVEDILCVSKDSMLVAQALTTLAASARNPGERGLFITFNRIQIEFARAAREFPSDDIQLTVVVPGPGNTPEEAQKGAIVAKRLQQGQADTFLFAIIGYDPTGYSPLASDNSAIVFGNPALMPFERMWRLRQTGSRCWALPTLWHRRPAVPWNGPNYLGNKPSAR